MGNKVSRSIPSQRVFEKELANVNQLVNGIISSNHQFKNSNYNFLSKEVCDKHTIVMESELNRHLKVSLKDLGTDLYLIPNNDNTDKKTASGKTINKRDICKKISNHYMKILYILTLIKYVYDLEHHGDYSISGIIFRNIRVVDKIMSIDYCSMPQKDYSDKAKNNKIDFGQLEGMSFFVDNVLNKEESRIFVDVVRSILARSKTKTQRTICSLIADKKLNQQTVREIESIYKRRYGTGLTCERASDTSKLSNNNTMVDDIPQHKRPGLYMTIEKDNPVFLKQYCYNVNRLVIQLDSSRNKEVLNAFTHMETNYKNNVKAIESIMNRLVIKNGDVYELKDVTKTDLDTIIDDVKSTIKLFYIQSILDYHSLLDIAKNNQNIEVNKER